MKSIKEFIENKKQKIRLQKEAELKSEFQVVERANRLWLTHNGVAFMDFPKDVKTEDVTESLNKSRLAAIIFEKL